MKKRPLRFVVVATLAAWVSVGLHAAPARKAATSASSSSTERALEAYAARFLSFDPETKVTAEKAPEQLPGFQGYKVKRTGRYDALKVDRTFYVSTDGKWFFAGDAATNPSPRAVKSSADLEWLETKFGTLFRSKVKALLTPERDAAGWKAVAVAVETGYGPVRIPGYVSPDGRHFFQGSIWDFRMDPRAERRRRIDLSLGRATGNPDATVTVVEYADMECGYCRFRGLQMDRLLEANAGVVNVRRHYKFFPLWFGHVWAMKAASAGDCFFQLAGPAFFRFKSHVYGRQEAMTVSGLDELAITVAEGEGVSSADFLSCYLQDESFARVRRDMEEGYRLGVVSTPTYYVDGTEISWTEDKVMEDFLRTLFPKTKTISYPKK